MNLIKEGVMNVYHEFSILEDDWNGYGAPKPNPKILNTLKDMTFVSNVINLFKLVGFKEIDIEIVPVAEGTYQFEASNDNVYLEVEVDMKFYKANNT